MVLGRIARGKKMRIEEAATHFGVEVEKIHELGRKGRVAIADGEVYESEYNKLREHFRIITIDALLERLKDSNLSVRSLRSAFEHGKFPHGKNLEGKRGVYPEDLPKVLEWAGGLSKRPGELTVEEAAALFKTKVKAIQHSIRTGKIQARKSGRNYYIAPGQEIVKKEPTTEEILEAVGQADKDGYSIRPDSLRGSKYQWLEAVVKRRKLSWKKLKKQAGVKSKTTLGVNYRLAFQVKALKELASGISQDKRKRQTQLDKLTRLFGTREKGLHVLEAFRKGEPLHDLLGITTLGQKQRLEKLLAASQEKKPKKWEIEKERLKQLLATFDQLKITPLKLRIINLIHSATSKELEKAKKEAKKNVNAVAVARQLTKNQENQVISKIHLLLEEHQESLLQQSIDAVIHEKGPNSMPATPSENSLRKVLEEVKKYSLLHGIQQRTIPNLASVAQMRLRELHQEHVGILALNYGLGKSRHYPGSG